MRLRQNTRLPGRYREEDVEDLPPNPTAVIPTTPFDPSLRPAAFPSLAFDQFHPEDLEAAAPTPASTSISGLPALVFRDRRPQEEPKMFENIDDPGDFPGYNDWSDDEQEETGPTYGLPAYDLHVDWSELAEGTKLMLIRELCRDMQFYDAVSFIQLEDGDITEFVSIMEREVSYHAEEGKRIARADARQVELLMRGQAVQAREEWAAVMEEEIHNHSLHKPTVFSISKDDVAKAKLFLQDFRYREEFPAYDPETTPEHIIADMNAIPPYQTLMAIIARLERYGNTATTYTELGFEGDILEMFHEAAELVEEYNESETVTEDDDEQADRDRPADLGTPAGLDSQAGLDSPTSLSSPADLHNLQPEESGEPGEIGQAEDDAYEPASKKKKAGGSRSSKKQQKGATSPGLAKPAKKGRAKPKATKGPSRLREVTNVEDLVTPTTSPTTALAVVTAATIGLVPSPLQGQQQPSRPLSTVKTSTTQPSVTTGTPTTTNGTQNIEQPAPVWTNTLSSGLPEKTAPASKNTTTTGSGKKVALKLTITPSSESQLPGKTVPEATTASKKPKDTGSGKKTALKLTVTPSSELPGEAVPGTTTSSKKAKGTGSSSKKRASKNKHTIDNVQKAEPASPDKKVSMPTAASSMQDGEQLASTSTSASFIEPRGGATPAKVGNLPYEYTPKPGHLRLEEEPAPPSPTSTKAMNKSELLQQQQEIESGITPWNEGSSSTKAVAGSALASPRSSTPKTTTDDKPSPSLAKKAEGKESQTPALDTASTQQNGDAPEDPPSTIPQKRFWVEVPNYIPDAPASKKRG